MQRTGSRGLKTVLVDLSGTLHVGKQPLPGSIQGLQKLRQANLQVCFVTNTTKETTSGLCRSLRSMGFHLEDNEVFSSLSAACRLLERQQLRPLLLLHPDAMPDFDHLPHDNPDAVVVGWAAEAFNFATLNRAFRLLMDKLQAPLIAIHKGRYLKDLDGGLSLGPGPFVAALEYATGRTSEVVGKPSRDFFLAALDALGTPPDQAVMVGDDVRDDVGGAQAAGIQGILVQTGKYLPGDEDKHGVQPYMTVPDFAAAVDGLVAGLEAA